MPWEAREPRAFFRGRPSSPQRWRLAELAEGREDIFDVRIRSDAGHDTSLFRRLVLGWIEADFRVQGRIF